MNTTYQSKKDIVRLEGRLKEITTIRDEDGNIIHRTVRPIMSEFYIHDLIQVIVGATIIAIPVGFTQEVWQLGFELSAIRTLGFVFFALFFIGIFSYHHTYENIMETEKKQFAKRVLFTYLVSCFVVGILLTLINQAQWSLDLVTSIKRVILVAFPASLGAAVTDVLK